MSGLLLNSWPAIAATAGILITNYVFSGPAKRLLAKHSNIFGLDKTDLRLLMLKYLAATAS